MRSRPPSGSPTRSARSAAFASCSPPAATSSSRCADRARPEPCGVDRVRRGHDRRARGSSILLCLARVRTLGHITSVTSPTDTPLGLRELQLATLVAEPPEGPDWLHEQKFDGYRILAELDRGTVRLLSRRFK